MEEPLELSRHELLIRFVTDCAKEKFNMATIETIKIHPAIGIARVGNSPTGVFIGPERPGTNTRPKGGFKDAQGRIKRQAARFRLFGYDSKGKLVKEITAKDASVSWTAHLANSKAAWKRFVGLNPNSPLRNASVTNRNSLVIDPGPRSLSGPNKTASFDTGTFLGSLVPLGEMRTDRQGHLLILGGFGSSGSPIHAPFYTPRNDFANRDGWYDDVSDGPVTATVTLKASGKTFNAVPSWVICAPPKFAPPIDNIITLYDTLLQVAMDKLGLKLPAKPSFTNDIYPILQRALNMKWVNQLKKMHKANMPPPRPPNDRGHADAVWGKIIPPPSSAVARKFIFDKLRDPALPPQQSSDPADMPMIWSDHYPANGNQPLTKIQYRYMKKWKDGNFIDDWSGPPKPPKKITPAGLDRTGLESCVGAAFFPGIETSWLLRDTYKFSEPFRLDHVSLQPGDLTKQMSVPWQSDFYACKQEGELAWWPAQRPDDVFPEGGGGQARWTRKHIDSPSSMVKNWHKLGFVVKKGSKYVETERQP
jgi:hypothetical protein